MADLSIKCPPCVLPPHPSAPRTTPSHPQTFFNSRTHTQWREVEVKVEADAAATEEATGAEVTHPVADTVPKATKVAAAALEATAVATVGVIEGDITEETEEGIVAETEEGLVVETEGASEEATVAGSAEIVVVEDLVVEVVGGAFNVLSSRSSGPVSS